jgi:hypothetical protein
MKSPKALIKGAQLFYLSAFDEWTTILEKECKGAQGLGSSRPKALKCRYGWASRRPCPKTPLLRDLWPNE